MRRGRDFSWPRIYGQLIRTGEIFELRRGSDCGKIYSVHLQAMESGPGWIVWSEHKARVAIEAPEMPAEEEVAS